MFIQRFVSMWMMVIIVFIITGTCQLTQAGPFDDTVSLCKERFGNARLDILITSCIDDQIESSLRFGGQWDSADDTGHYLFDEDGQITDETYILLSCAEEWTDSKGRRDWVEIDRCTDDMMKEYNDLREYLNI